MAPVAAGETTPARNVLLRGRQVVRDGAVVGLDVEKLRREAREALATLLD